MLTYDPALNPLRDVLARIYPKETSAPLVAETAGLDITQIELSGNPQERWHAILRYAYQNDQVDKLIEIVTGNSPNNETLKEAVDSYRSAPSPQISTVTPDHDLYILENKLKLRNILVERFSIGDLKDLTDTMGIDYENIAGSTKSGKARELVNYLERRKQLEDLVSIGKELRKDIDWP